MNGFSATFRDTSFDGITVEEATEWIEQLRDGIQSAQQSAELGPLHITDGYMTRDDIIASFRPLYPDFDTLYRRAPRMFGRIVHSSRNRTHGFKVVCIICDMNISGKTQRESCSHSKHNRNLKVDVRSLVRHSDAFLQGTTRQLGTNTCQDFKRLVQALKDRT
ncbi:MAG TPA: hypothetical protein PK096_01695 [Candidatus Saccharibacteria bacterium]|nr:hypothetical protein [Candidatus Saccharibacteria bacterium]